MQEQLKNDSFGMKEEKLENNVLIKSSLVIKKIFSYLEQKRKLKMIIYNNKYQKNLGINIENYKNASGKLVEIDKNGNAKEYYLTSKELMFEGEYKNKKRNGKGKEFHYSNGKIKFEGEYKNGLKWEGKGYNPKGNLEYELKNGNGKIKEYGEYDMLIFEGEYLDGKKHGKGIEYYEHYRVKFNGEYLNGEKWKGKGFIYDENGMLILEEEYSEGKIWKKIEKKYNKYKKLILEIEYSKEEEFNKKGKGKEYAEGNKLIFEGEYLNKKRNGKGKEYFCPRNEGRGENVLDPKIKFVGEFKNGLKWEGKGYNPEGDLVYELKNGNGKIKEYGINGDLSFEGEYLNGIRNGKGKEYHINKNLLFEGEYKNGLKWDGKGYNKEKKLAYELKNGKGYIKEFNKSFDLIFEGEYLNGIRNGKGKEYYYDYDDHINGELIFEGEYLNGKRLKGKGKEYQDGYLLYEGEYSNGMKNGKGKEYGWFEWGNSIFEGEFLNGKKWNGIETGYDFMHGDELSKSQYTNGKIISCKKGE